jgi:hypothetical protein
MVSVSSLQGRCFSRKINHQQRRSGAVDEIANAACEESVNFLQAYWISKTGGMLFGIRHVERRESATTKGEGGLVEEPDPRNCTNISQGSFVSRKISRVGGEEDETSMRTSTPSSANHVKLPISVSNDREEACLWQMSSVQLNANGNCGWIKTFGRSRVGVRPVGMATADSKIARMSCCSNANSAAASVFGGLNPQSCWICRWHPKPPQTHHDRGMFAYSAFRLKLERFELV